ncbi:MAG TPA: 3D domain-containing protein [Thermoanaerobaculia bacterium]|jgi:3D (Asp-Asp-Asp) domain-containing protein|nr:3D domain-containing protein [Thermoanaerobaculia bacterium]
MHVKLSGRSVAALMFAALVLPWSVPANAADPPPITDFTSYTYSVPAVGIGAFADFPVSRTFDQPIGTLKLFIVAGRADDIGYVGSRLVTSVPAQCTDVGTVTGEQDVSDQVTISGNTASFLLRAQENCCCVTGWGSATQSDRADARFRWEVTFGNATTATVTATDPIIPTESRVNASHCVLYRADLTGTVTKAGQPQPDIALQFKSDRGSADTFTQPAAPTNAAGTATGNVSTRKQGTANITAANSDIATTSPAAIVFGAANYESPFRYTGYIIASEADYPGALVDACGLDRQYSAGFLFGGIPRQGTGEDSDGRFIQQDYARNRNEHRTGTQRCFHYVTCARGSSGRCVQAGVSIAVDTSIIPMDASVNLQGYGSRTADDTGTAITGYHIDLFLGLGFSVLRGHTLTHGTIRYLSGGGSCN